jgi:hypothetical protein
LSSGSNPPFSQSGVATIAASTTSASALLPAAGDVLVVSNPTAAVAWIAVGGGVTPGTAVAGAGYPVLPAGRRIIGIGSLVTWVAAVLSTGSGAVYVETGTGSMV